MSKSVIAIIVIAAGTAAAALSALLPNRALPDTDDEKAEGIRMAELRTKATEDFKRIADAYAGAERLSMRMEHRLYATYESREPIEVEHGFLCRDGKRLYNDGLGSVTVLTEDLQIQINKEGRRIIISRRPDETPAGLLPSDTEIEASLEFCDSLHYRELSGERGTYRMWYAANASYRYIDMEFNLLSGFIERSILYLKPEAETDETDDESPSTPRVEIVYTGIDTVSVDEELFREERYVRREGNRFSCGAEYAGYELADLRAGGEE